MADDQVTPPAAAHLLLAELDRRAAQEADEARRLAGEEAAQIGERARADAERRAAEARGGREREAARTLSVARADALLQARHRLLPARAAALARVFAKAAECIEARATHPDVNPVLEPLVVDALRYLPDGGTRVRCAPQITGAVRRALDRAGRADADVIADAGVPLGAILESADGVLSVDATFGRRLARDRAGLAADVGRKLLAGRP